VRILALACASSIGCAVASGPNGFVAALGEHAHAEIYSECEPAPPVLLPEDAVVVEERRQEIDRTFPASDEKRVTTITSPAALAPPPGPASPALALRAEGAAISKTLGGVLRLVASTAWQAIKAIFGAPVP